MNKHEAQTLANLTGCTVYLYNNGDHAAAGSTRAAELCAAGLSVVQVFRPE